MKRMALFLSVLALLLLPTPQNSSAQQPRQKIFWMATIEVPMGKLPDYHAFAEKELVPVQEKYGYHFVGAWQTIVGEIEEVVMIAEFENMAAYQQARVDLLASEEWKLVSPKMTELTKGIRTRFLSATPYSKIK